MNINSFLKHKILYCTTTITVALLSFSTSVSANSNSQLTKSQIQLLKVSGIPIIIPGYVPKDFHLDKISITDGGDKFTKSYTITYTGKAFSDGTENQFYIETTGDGIGDLIQSDPISVKTNFGTLILHIDAVFEGNNLKLNNCAETEWFLYKNNAYRFLSGGGCNDATGASPQKRISKEEIIKVLKSLKELK